MLLVPVKFQWKEPEQIVFATNYQKTERQALAIIFSMAKLYIARVTVVHLYNVDVLEEEKGKNNFDTYAYALQREFNEFNLKFQLLKTSSVTKTMENLYKEIPYDMVAMMRRKKTFMERFFLKSFTKNMAYITNHPLLVVPEEE